MNAVSSPEALLRLVGRSHLLSAEQLAPYAERLRRGASPTAESLAAQLQRDGLITPYQVRQLLLGRPRSLFLTEKYKVLDLVGEGGMGRVYLCEHLVLEKLVAVKVLALGDTPVPGALERFLREARAAAALDAPNIARTFDADFSPDGPFLVMEYVDGVNLHQLVAILGPLDVTRAAQYVRQAALGLQHAHERGLVHRDIKPGNLMVDRAGTVKLLDLGLARYFDAPRNRNLTRRFDAKNVLGTAEFIAPEQALNSSAVDTRADIYSLGCTFYFLLTARFPFADGSPAEKFRLHVTTEFDPVESHRPGVPAGLLAVLRKMVRKDPAERYGTPGEVAEALAPWATRPVPPPSPEELPPASRLQFALGLCPAPPRSWLAAARPEDSTPVPGPRALADWSTPRGAAASTPRAAEPETERFAPQAAPRRPLVTPARLAVLLAALALGLAAGVAAVKWDAAPDRARAVADPPAAPTALKASGSTSAQPLLARWASAYAGAGTPTLEYAGTGSTRGVAAMIEGVTDFGVTGVPLTDAQVRSAANVGGEVLHLPVAVGAVAAVYHLPARGQPIRLTGPLLAAIYLGKITAWNDEAFQGANPGVAMPALPITLVRRADGCGATYQWTDYLSTVSAEWKARVGAAAEPEWPPTRAVFARGSDGVAREVARTPGALGYLELTHAAANGLSVAPLRNRHGDSVAPSPAGVRSALDSYGSDLPADLRVSLIDRPGAGSYPVVGVTWLVAYRRQTPAKAEALRRFLTWAVRDGQPHAEGLNFQPVPPTLRPGLDALIATIGETPGG